MQLMKIDPTKQLFDNTISIPSSKPETQRAIFIGSFSEGISEVHNDLRCIETSIMKRACKVLGAEIDEERDRLRILGAKGILKKCQDVKVINSSGSGLVARLFTVLGSLTPKATIITGDKILRTRVMKPLFSNLRRNGVQIEYLGDEYKLPIINWNSSLPGGSYSVPGNISSQFITAFLLTAPFAEDVVEIRIEGDVYSKPYIKQTLVAMQAAGIQVEYTESMNYYKVHPGEYSACNTYVMGDYTSASYVLAKAALFSGKTTLKNMSSKSYQGEKAIVGVLEALGVTLTFNEDTHELIAENSTDCLKGDVEFNAIDFPNIVPTLATIGAFVEGRFRVIGAAITRFHKSSRVEAMITELKKIGVNINPIFKDDILDGFEIRGKQVYEGGVQLSSWKDHRIFMSLFVLSLKMQHSNYIDGFSDIDCSFPSFLGEFEKMGVAYSVIGTDSQEEVYQKVCK